VTVEYPMDQARFRRSSFCSLSGCVEVGRLSDGRVAVRDSKNRELPALIFSRGEWAEFLAGARAGEFD
jgi:hypothetical protein